MEATIFEDARKRITEMNFLDLSAFVRRAAEERKAKISQLVGGRPTKANRIAFAINYEYSKNLQKAREQAEDARKKAATLAKRRATIAGKKAEAERIVKQRQEAERIAKEMENLKFYDISVPDFAAMPITVKIAVPKDSITLKWLGPSNARTSVKLRLIKIANIRWRNDWRPINFNNLDDEENEILDRAINLFVARKVVDMGKKLAGNNPLRIQGGQRTQSGERTGPDVYAKINGQKWANIDAKGGLRRPVELAKAVEDLGSFYTREGKRYAPIRPVVDGSFD